jgi:hypothetical protein
MNGEARLAQGHQLNLLEQAATPSLWPTPCAQEDGKSPEAHLAMKARMKGGPRKTVTSLTVAAKLWPTPRNDHSGLESHGVTALGGSLNPRFVEELMGFEIDHSACEHWATRSSQPKPTRSSKRSPRWKGAGEDFRASLLPGAEPGAGGGGSCGGGSVFVAPELPD